MKKIFTTIFVFLLLIFSEISNAQLITEPFNYTASATANLATQSGFVWNRLNTGDSIIVESGNLSYPGLTTSSGNRVTYGGTGTDTWRPFTNQTSGTVYASVLLNISNISSQTTTGGYTFGFIENNSTTNFGATIWIRNNTASGTTQYNLGINPRTTVANTAWASNVLDTGTTYLIVIAYQIVSGTSNDIVSMWINPTSLGGTAPTSVASATNTGTDLNGVQRIFMRQDAAGTTPTLRLDEIKVGTTYSDVTPSVISANTTLAATTFNNLTVNGSGITVSLGGNTNITGALTLTDGTLAVGTYSLTFSGSSPSRTSGSIDASNGSANVIFNNSSAITLPSSLFTGNINRLTLNNSGNVTSSSPITVADSLDMMNGILIMGANTLTLGTSISNVGVLNRTTGGAIRGTIKRWFATATTTTGSIFPISNYHWVTGSGYTDDYVAVSLDFTSGGPSTGGSVTVRYDTTGSGTLFDNGGLGYIDVGTQWSGVNFINLSPQFWTITGGDGLSGFTYDISLTGLGMGVSTTSTLYTGILKRTNNTQPWAWSFGNHTNTTGSSTPILGGHGFSNFSEFAIGGNVDNLLPVELSSFTSAISGRDLLLSWSTGTEINNSGFDIERKSTTGGWSKIGFVAGHGTVNTPNSYTYTDANLSSGKYNYRLKQIDFNGNYKYYNLSNEVIIGTPSKYVLTQNFPNPFNPSTSISYEIPATNFVSLKIYDMMGKEVANLVNGTQEAGFYTVKFDASKLASGVYFYKLQANDFTATKKLMLMK